MEELTKLKEHLEYMFLKVIINGLRDNSISIEQSKAFAQEFLVSEPFASVEDARAKIHSYTTTHPQFITLRGYIDSYHQEQKVSEVIEKMRTHIKNNDIDQALQVAKTY